MPIEVIIIATILLQTFAAILALRLIALTHRRSAWLLLSAAIVLLVIHDIVALHFFRYATWSGELIMLAIALLLTAGVWRIHDTFKQIKHTEEMAEMGKHYYQSLFTNNRTAMLLIDPADAAIVDANPAACDFYGYSHAELTRKKMNDLSTNSSEDIFSNIHRARTNTRNFFIIRHKRANGDICTVEVYCGPVSIQNQQLLYATIHDITEQKPVTASLKELSYRSQQILNTTAEGIYGLDTEGNVTFINRSAEKMTGWGDAELIGKHHHSLVHHSHADGTPYPSEDCLVHHTIRTGKTHYVRDEVFWRQDGSSFPVAYTSAPIRDETGNITGVVVSFRDISREREVEQTRVRLETVIEQAAESVEITNTDGIIEYVNPAFTDITGYSYREAVGQTPRLLKSGKHPEEFYRQLWETITAGKVWRGQFTNKKKDGSLFTEEATISPVFNEAGEIINFVAVKRDITTELELESQYRQAQKMEALGRLTGGVAHDFNNILTAINGFAELLLARLGDDATSHRYTQTILESGERAADLIRQLMVFSRKNDASPQHTNANTVIQKMGNMLERLLTENITLSTALKASAADILIDPTQLQQVILNLVVNARDALPHGGKIYIGTEDVHLDSEFVATHFGAKEGPHVCISVVDNGMGMSETVQERIFEPFFTTKSPGEGTGMGLATVFGIVTRYGGTIWVDSELGAGTEFKIYFPVVTEADGTNLPATNIPARLATSSGVSILVVEDNSLVRDLATKILTEAGYTVMSAGSAEDALELSLSAVDLLLTDVILPGMNGKALGALLSETYPHLKIVYMSGYTHDIIARQDEVEPNIALLEKPFSAASLLTQIALTLGR